MPGFVEFLKLFGSQFKPTDLRHSGFREETTLMSPHSKLDSPAFGPIGRSGNSFELCYNVKGITEKGPKSWSIRHTAVYHKFDTTFGTALWIIVKGSLDLKDPIEPVTARQAEEQEKHLEIVEQRFVSTLAIHSLVALWAGESWRSYLRYMENEVENAVRIPISVARPFLI